MTKSEFFISGIKNCDRKLHCLYIGMNSKLPYNKQVQLSSIKSNVTENVIKFKALKVEMV